MTEKERIQKIKDFFPNAHQTSNDYRSMIEQLIIPTVSLLPKNENEDKAVLGNNINKNLIIQDLINVKLDEEGQEQKEVFKSVIELMQGSPNWASSLSMNIIPQSNKIAIPTFLLVSIFSPSILESDININIEKAEYEVGTMLSDLVWNELEHSGCIFTHGPEEGWFFALQYAKARVLKNSSKEGLFNTQCKVICSKVAQIAKERSIIFSGIGSDNLIQISVDENNKINLNELEEVLKDLNEKDIPVACIVCTLGTKNVNAFDPIKDIYELTQKYPNNESKYGKTLIYVDANLSFTWLTFKDYDFNYNNLGFGEDSLPIIKSIYETVSEIKYADCFSTDFHLSGYCPGVTSSFHFKDANEFNSLMHYDRLDNYSSNDTSSYNARNIHSSIGAIAAWATLKYFGKNGFRLINGQQIEYVISVRELINKEDNMCTINVNDYDQTILFRVYDDEVISAKNQYQNELSDSKYKDQLIKNNEFNYKVYQKLIAWYRDLKQIDGKYTPYIAFTNNLRNTKYNNDSNKEEIINCLKIYSSQFNASLETIEWLISCLKIAIKEVKKEEKQI